MDTPKSSSRVRLVETAERLIAQRGVHGVSLREIAAEAGQRNTGAVRYHFGSKQALVAAIFEHRMAPINARRMELITELDDQGRAHDPYALAEAFVVPLSEILDRPGRTSWYLRFCVQARYTVEPGTTVLNREGVGVRPWTKGLVILHDRAMRLLAGLPEQLRVERWARFSGSPVHALADHELRLEAADAQGADSFGLLVSDLVDTSVAVLTAPVRPATLRLVGQTNATPMPSAQGFSPT
ncbi:TetR/AcrR family transcriptional regulator [Streptomyces sp. NPDC051286]|uniref:TetR/AcrR family transcriptional regulator n=1 Tax=Streptomyces sp. NPDC051286 TaxID=3365647 RepID=UPI0037A28AD9